MLEGMAFGKPVVATAVGGVPGVITNGENGFLIPPGDLMSLVERVRFLLEDPAIRDSIGMAARNLIREKFSDLRMVTQMDEFYREILSG